MPRRTELLHSHPVHMKQEMKSGEVRFVVQTLLHYRDGGSVACARRSACTTPVSDVRPDLRTHSAECQLRRRNSPNKQTNGHRSCINLQLHSRSVDFITYTCCFMRSRQLAVPKKSASRGLFSRRPHGLELSPETRRSVEAVSDVYLKRICFWR